MKRLMYFAMTCALGGSAALAAAQAVAGGCGLYGNCTDESVGSIAGVAIVDRDSGATLRAHYFRGEYWVAGKPGARYAIEITNRLGERVLAVTQRVFRPRPNPRA